MAGVLYYRDWSNWCRWISIFVYIRKFKRVTLCLSLNFLNINLIYFYYNYWYVILCTRKVILIYSRLGDVQYAIVKLLELKRKITDHYVIPRMTLTSV